MRNDRMSGNPHSGIQYKDGIAPREPQAAGPERARTHYLPWYLTTTVTMSIPWYFWWLTEDA